MDASFREQSPFMPKHRCSPGGIHVLDTTGAERWQWGECGQTSRRVPSVQLNLEILRDFGVFDKR